MIGSCSPTTCKGKGGGEGRGGRGAGVSNNNKNKEQRKLYVLVMVYCYHMRNKILSQYVPGPGDKERNPGVSFTTVNFKYSV